MLDFCLSWTPVLLIAGLATIFKRQALELAVWAAAGTSALVMLWFKTPPDVVVLSCLDGILRNLPLLLVIYTGMLLSGLMLSTGSLTRFVDWLSVMAGNRRRSVMMIAVGSGNFMEGAGIIAEPIIAPMLLSAGLPPMGAAALSVAGYSGLMILEMGGAILAVLALVTELDPNTLGIDVALISLPATLLVTLSMPRLTYQETRLRDHLPLTLAVGCLAGGGALFSAHFMGGSVAGLFGGLIVLAGLGLTGARISFPDSRIIRDMAPLLLLVAGLFSINLIPPLRKAAMDALSFGVSVVPGHEVRFQPIFSAYTYILLSYLFAAALLGDKKAVRQNFRETNMRAWKPVLAMALFGAAGQIIAYSGYHSGFAEMDPGRNVALILANGMVALSGNLYPLFVPLIGWIGTFLTGYGTASIVMFGKLHVATAQMLGDSPSMTVSALAVGSAVGSISSPFKIALAASMCGAVGREGEILRRTIPLGIVISLLLGIVLLVLLKIA